MFLTLQLLALTYHLIEVIVAIGHVTSFVVLPLLFNVNRLLWCTQCYFYWWLACGLREFAEQDEGHFELQSNLTSTEV